MRIIGGNLPFDDGCCTLYGWGRHIIIGHWLRLASLYFVERRLQQLGILLGDIKLVLQRIGIIKQILRYFHRLLLFGDRCGIVLADKIHGSEQNNKGADNQRHLIFLYIFFYFIH